MSENIERSHSQNFLKPNLTPLNLQNSPKKIFNLDQKRPKETKRAANSYSRESGSRECLASFLEKLIDQLTNCLSSKTNVSKINMVI